MIPLYLGIFAAIYHDFKCYLKMAKHSYVVKGKILITDQYVYLKI